MSKDINLVSFETKAPSTEGYHVTPTWMRLTGPLYSADRKVNKNASKGVKKYLFSCWKDGKLIENIQTLEELREIVGKKLSDNAFHYAIRRGAVFNGWKVERKKKE